MFLKYDPLQQKYKSITGAVPISLPFVVSVHSDAAAVELMLKKEGEGEAVVAYPMTRDGENFYLSLTITTTGLYRYYFSADGENFYADAALNASRTGEKWTLTAYEAVYDAPEWIYGGIIYQIFPDRFSTGGERLKTKPDMIYRDDWGGVPYYKPNERGIVENRDMFGGNFRGIAEKMEYLASLGVTLIYLNPVFESYSNHKYDTANYAVTDSDFGTLKDFALMIAQAEKYGIKVMLDGVFSHTGSDSIYFNKNGRFGVLGAFNSPDSPYREWYNFQEYPDKYDCWWGIKTLPNINENNASFCNYICGDDGVIARYMNMGVAGWRIDVADELPDEFLENVVKAAKKARRDAMVLGEVWENAATKYSYGRLRHYLCGRQLDSVTDYPLKNAVLEFVQKGSADAVDNAVRRIINDYPERVVNALMNFIDTHDTVRALTTLGTFGDVSTKDKRSDAEILDYDAAATKLRQAAVLQYFLPGVPSVYYGDEAGMYGFEDPFNRRCYPWGKEDKSLVEYYIRLGKIRRAHQDILARGSYERAPAPAKVLRFYRTGGSGKLEITVNASDNPYELPCKGKDLLTGAEVSAVGPRECAVIKRARCKNSSSLQ